MVDTLEAAAASTAALLERAIEIVEDEFGADLENRHAPIIGAVLLTLAAEHRAPT